MNKTIANAPRISKVTADETRTTIMGRTAIVKATTRRKVTANWQHKRLHAVQNAAAMNSTPYHSSTVYNNVPWITALFTIATPTATVLNAGKCYQSFKVQKATIINGNYRPTRNLVNKSLPNKTATVGIRSRRQYSNIPVGLVFINNLNNTNTESNKSNHHRQHFHYDGNTTFLEESTVTFEKVSTNTTISNSVISTTHHSHPTTLAPRIRYHNASTAITTPTSSTKNRASTIIIYPTVSPESIVIPIISCIFGFPILALMVICCLRHRAKLARERDRRRKYEMQDHAISLVRFGTIHRFGHRGSRMENMQPEGSLSPGFVSLELETVIEEQTQTETLQSESTIASSPYKISFSSN